MHAQSLPLITTLATALALALLMGIISARIKLPPLVGYLLAGVILGPFTPGMVANAQIASEFAEIGVMLLMFGVGLHFSLEHLLATAKIALPGALLQITVATSLGALLAICWGWSVGGALIFGLALSVASTVVLIRALEAEDILNSTNGKIAIGWLIIEDITMIFVLVILPLFGEWFGGNGATQDKNIWLLAGLTLVKIAAFLVLMLWVGRKVFPKLLWYVASTGSRELFTLCVITAALSIAYVASELFGISYALGAFFSGMIIRESQFSRRAAEESLPFRDAFAVLFFVSVGMLFDPYIFLQHPFEILMVVIIIVFGKSFAAGALVLALRYPLNTALTVSASLAQIGEFSLILAGLGMQLKLLPKEGYSLILAGALISIAINPLIFRAIKPIQQWLESKFPNTDSLADSNDPLAKLPLIIDKKYLSGQIILVGYGRVGRRIERILTQQGLPFVIIEEDHELVSQLRQRNISAVYGDASTESVLSQAYIADAGMLVISTSNLFNIRGMTKIVHTLNPKIAIAIRVTSNEEALELKKEIKGKFFFSERELAVGMGRYILARFGIPYPEERE